MNSKTTPKNRIEKYSKEYFDLLETYMLRTP
jgi:hypothetical protein